MTPIAMIISPIICLYLLISLHHGILLYGDPLKDPVKYIRPPETIHIPCEMFMKRHFLSSSMADKYRVKYKDPDDLPIDCNSIMERNNFHMAPMSKEENQFPLAYARNVFADYRFLEIVLSSTYAPQNFYCFSVDGKAPPLFRKRMNALSMCLENVHVTNLMIPMDSLGHNTNLHHNACLKWLIKGNKTWEYVMLLQNYDVPLHTNEEMVQILKWYNGTNDVTTQMRDQFPGHRWDFYSLDLFKDRMRNRQTVNGAKPELLFTRSMVQTTMSRAAIDFIFRNLNLETTIHQLNSYPWTTVDEFLMSMLNSNDNIQLPGGFTRKCGDKTGTIIGMTRFNVWIRNSTKCYSNFWRNNACIFGLEDLKSKFVDNRFFTANKMIPRYDFGAIVCWNEVLFNRTHNERGIHRLKKDAYVKLPQVRFNKERRELGPKFNADLFDCTAYQNESIGTNILESGIRIIEAKKR